MKEIFDLRTLNKPSDEIIPLSDSQVSINDALEEIKPVVEILSEDVSGIGQKAAERYLLRYEYGISTQELTTEFDVSPQTISNQVTTVRNKLFRYPRLAQEIGTLRAQREEISCPDIEKGSTWMGEVILRGESLEYSAKFLPGGPGKTYSWGYACECRYKHNGKIHHLFADYLVDQNQGVFLKRLSKAFSGELWCRPPIGDRYIYRAYALPNLEVPNTRDGSLIDAAEYHFTYDIKTQMESIIADEGGDEDLATKLGRGEKASEDTACLPLQQNLPHRIRNCDDTEKTIEDYSGAIHIRDNVERLLRTYPLDDAFKLPDGTVSLLWNGPSTIQRDSKSDWRQYIKEARGSYKGRNIRASTGRYTSTDHTPTLTEENPAEKG